MQVIVRKLYILLTLTITNIGKCSKFWDLSDYIWNHHEKCIQISTNMPGIGLFCVCEISRVLRNKTILFGLNKVPDNLDIMQEQGGLYLESL